MLSKEEKYFMDKNSRQFDTLGGKAMQNFPKASILVVGLGGVGVETAKNLVLAGPGRVVIADDRPVVPADLGVNFLISEKDVGKQRAAACLPGLAELNQDMKVERHEGPVTEDVLKDFVAVIVTDSTPLATLQKWDSFCHANGITFLFGSNNGGLATVFSDFGAKHVVTDGDGENVTTHNVQSAKVLRSEKDGKEELVLEVTAKRHGLGDDSDILVGSCIGMEALNGKVLRVKRVYQVMQRDDKGKVLREVLDSRRLRVTHIDGKEFSVELLADSKSPEYKSGGTFTLVKPKQELAFSSLAESVVNPKTGDLPFLFHPGGFEMMLNGRTAQLHLARQALWAFQAAHDGELPQLHSAEDAAECCKLAEEANNANKAREEGTALVVEEVDRKIVSLVALYSRAELLGLCTFLGGVVAQEIIKIWGKTTPIHQWLYDDYLNLLPEEPREDAVPKGCRYDHQIAVFGSEFQDKLQNMTWFLVGCGALGCEYLKGFALMGIGTGGKGKLHVTDYDHIELSNLTRQLLFRKEDMKKPKSVTGGRRAKIINPDINVVVHESLVGPETEDRFNDAFFNSLDGVCNALDNVKARQYTDSRCVFYEKPLLESGTLGTKCNSEIILPHKTKCYRDDKDEDQPEGIPLCTLRNFPSLIEHCLEWSRSGFAELFVKNVKDANAFLENPQEFLAKAGPKSANSVLRMVSLRQANSYEACIRAALEEFNDKFDTTIRNLIWSYPRDFIKKDKESGTEEPFWSGSKRFPRAASFEPSSRLDLEFLLSTANLYAATLGLPAVNDMKEFEKIIQGLDLKPAEWEPPKQKVQTLENEENKEEDMGDMSPAVRKALESADHTGLAPLVEADFEKDDDTNFHIDFIAASANLRAWNYEIGLCTRHKCKMIAGRITPALATTTALITGLVELELCKLVLGFPKDKMFASNVNLALPYTMNHFEPDDPIKAKGEYDHMEMCVVEPIPAGFTVWDKVIVDEGNLTLKEFLEVFSKVHHGVEILMLYSSGASSTNVLWGSDMVVQKKLAEVSKAREPRNLVEVFEEVYGKDSHSESYLVLEGQFEKDDDAVKIPVIKYVFKK